MTYSVRVTFEEFTQQAARSGVCPACGKRGKRSRTFTMTQSPWNKNPDGSVRSVSEIRRALRDQARTWSQGAFVHERCERKT